MRETRLKSDIAVSLLVSKYFGVFVSIKWLQHSLLSRKVHL